MLAHEIDKVAVQLNNLLLRAGPRRLDIPGEGESAASQVQAEIDKTARTLSWSVDLALAGRTIIYPLQSALPPPARVMAALNEAPLSSITTWGDKRQVTLPSNFGKK